jgi:molybdopterin converting factor small subunit
MLLFLLNRNSLSILSKTSQRILSCLSSSYNTHYQAHPTAVPACFQIHQINKTVKSASELKNEIKNSDVVAVVAPIELQAEFLQVANGIPVISCRNKRILIQNQEGTETKVEFAFNGWYEIEKIDIVTRDL